MLISFNEGMSDADAEESKTLIMLGFFFGIGIGVSSVSYVSNNYGRKLTLVLA
jgi:hypothetical protein